MDSKGGNGKVVKPTMTTFLSTGRAFCLGNSNENTLRKGVNSVGMIEVTSLFIMA